MQARLKAAPSLLPRSAASIEEALVLTVPTIDQPVSGDTLPARQEGLGYFFSPSGVAIVGASRDQNKLGYGVVQNLRDWH